MAGSQLTQVRSAIGRAADVLGLDGSVAARCTSVYQQLYVAKPVPDPYTEPGKMEILLGPQVGKLGPATKRASVIVLTYNSMGSIETCLNSVLPTLGPNDELILVDNASQDGTEEWISDLGYRIADQRATVILNEENLGFSKGCNIGILHSKGEFLVLLNPDTLVWPGWIESLIAPLADENVGATGPLSDNVAGEQFVGLHVPAELMTSREEVSQAVRSQRSSHNALRSTKLLIGFCLGLRRDLLERFGLLEERCFLGADDLEIFVEASHAWIPPHDRERDICWSRKRTKFSKLGSGEKEKLVRQSDCELIEKIRAFYGSTALPSSRDVWDCEIFSEAMESSAPFA